MGAGAVAAGEGGGVARRESTGRPIAKLSTETATTTAAKMTAQRTSASAVIVGAPGGSGAAPSGAPGGRSASGSSGLRGRSGAAASVAASGVRVPQLAQVTSDTSASAPAGISDPHHGHQRDGIALDGSIHSMPIWAPARAPLEANPRTRVVVHTDPRLSSSWLAALAARSDVSVERADLAEGLAKPARDARLVVVEMPDLERDGATALEKIRALRAEKIAAPVVVLVGAPGQPLPAAVAATAREVAFAAGATDVVFLPDDQDRLEETVCALAGITARRYTRHRVRLNVTLEDGGIEKFPAVAENLSRGGIQLRLTRPLTHGQVIRMRLPLSASGTPLEAWGLVRGAAPTGSGHIARLRFVGMRPGERKDLDHFLGGLDRDTRSTEPAEAIAAVRRLDAAWLRSGVLEPAAAPDWLESALANLTKTERHALEPGAKFDGWWVWAAIAVARAQTLALTDALEKYDPVIDDEPEAARETVLEVVGKLRPAMDEFERMTRNQSEPDVLAVREELAALTGRLERAVSARVPELGGALDRVSGYLQTLRRLEEVEEAGDAVGRARLRNRLYAMSAGLMLSAAIVYAFVAFASRGGSPSPPSPPPSGTTP